METRKWKHLDIKDLVQEHEYDPNLAVIEGENDKVIVTEHDFRHWVEENPNEISVEIFRADTIIGSRLVYFTKEELLKRCTREVDIMEWGHYFGIKSRVKYNYYLLLESMRSVGLSILNMPTWRREK